MTVRSLLRRLARRPQQPAPDLDALISSVEDPWRPESQLRIYDQLKAAVSREWASKAARAYVNDPDGFLRHYFELRVEHSHPAELTADEREWFARLASDRIAAQHTKEARS